jgi:hypothetical protein
MNSQFTSRVRVVADYQAPYIDPISGKAGDEVVIDRAQKTEYMGWLWCINRAGKSGWVPESYLEERGNLGYLLCDYDAIELSIHVGETLIVHKATSGFLWVSHPCGQTGWVPASHVEPIYEDA